MPNNINQEYLNFLATNQPPAAPEPPPDPAQPAAEEMMVTPGINARAAAELAAISDKTLVKHFADTERYRAGILSGIGAGLRGLALDFLGEPGAHMKWQQEEWQMQKAVGTLGKTEKDINAIGLSAGAYATFRQRLGQHGLELDMSPLDFGQKLSRHLKAFDPSWRGRLRDGDMDDLIATAALQVAMGNARFREDTKADHEGAVWGALHQNLIKDLPDYQRPPARLRRELQVMENYLAATKNEDLPSLLYYADNPHTKPVLNDWYMRLSGRKPNPDKLEWPFGVALEKDPETGNYRPSKAKNAPMTVAPEELRRVLEPFVQVMRGEYVRRLEAEKWARIGLNIPPELINPHEPTMPLETATFNRSAVDTATYARDNGVSFTDPHRQSLENAQIDAFKVLRDSPEEILGRLYKAGALDMNDEVQPRLVGGAEEGQYGAPATRRQKWDEAVAGIKAQSDPQKRYMALMNALADNGVSSDAMRQAYTAMVTERAAEDAALQQPKILAWDSARPNWNPAQSQAAIEAGYLRRAEEIEATKEAERIVKEAPGLHLVTWAINAASVVAEETGLAALDRALITPLSDIMLDERKYAGLTNIEKQLMGASGSLGQWFNRQMGVDGLSERWAQYYISKVKTGQAGWGDHAFFTGAVILGGMLEMGGFALDSPLQMAAIGKVLHKWHGLREPVAGAMIRAGVPRAFIAGATLAMDPIAPGRSINALLGRTPAGVRALGVGEERWARELRNATPEYRAKARALADDTFRVLEETGKISDRGRIEAARTIYSSILSRADAGERITYTDAHTLVESLEGMSESITRRLLSPFGRHGASYNAQWNALQALRENVAAGAEERRISRLVAEEAAAQGVGVTPTKLWFDAYQAFWSNKYEGWRSFFQEGPGKLLGKAGEAFLNIVDKRIERGAMLPTWEKVAWLGAHRLQALDAESQSFCAEMKWAQEMAKSEIAVAKTQAKALEKQRRLLLRTGQGESPTFQMVLQEMAENQKELGELQTFRERCYVDEQKVRQLRKTRMAYVIGEEGIPAHFGTARGLEAGFRSALTAGEKQRMARYLVGLGQYAHEEAGRMGFTQATMRGINEANEALKKRADAFYGTNANRALCVARRYAIEGDWETAARVLATRGIKGVKANEAEVIGALIELSEKINKAEDKAFETTARELAAKLDVENGWGFKPFEADMTEAIRAVRKQVADNDILQRGAPAATLTDYLIEPHYMTGGRLTGLIAQQTESGAHRIKALVERLREEGHAFSIKDRELLAQVSKLHPNDWPEDLPGNVRELAMRTRQVQEHIIDMARDLHLLDDTEAARLRDKGYDDRHYVVHDMLRELESRGRAVRKETATENVRMMESAPLMRFTAAASPDFARVFYRDWRDHGHWKEHTEDVAAAGSPQAATARANKWVKDQVDKGRFRKGDYTDTVSPLTENSAVMKGLYKGSYDDRLQVLSKLYNELARRQMFAQFAKMTSLVRDRWDSIPQTDQTNWIQVKGHEWGTLDGRFINRRLVREINSWTGFSKVLSSVMKEAQESLASLGHLDMITAPAKPSKLGGLVDTALDKFDRIVRHNKIMWNVKSWMNNVLGNFTAAYAAGINPLSPSFFRYSLEYDRFTNELPRVERDAKLQGDRKTPGTEWAFIDAYRYGLMQRPIAVPEEAKVRAGTSMTQFYNLLNAKEQAKMNIMVERYEGMEYAAKNAEANLKLHGAKMKDRTRAEVEERAAHFRQTANEMREALMREAARFGVEDILREGGVLTPQKGGFGMIQREVLNFAFNPDASIIRNIVSSRYGSVDAKYKWAAYRCMRDQGLSHDAAIERVSHFFQNFGALPPVVRDLQKRRITGAFVPGFPAEAVRVLHNVARENPSRMLGLFGMVGMWNAGVGFLTGTAPSDFYQLGDDGSALDYIRRLFFALHVPTGDGRMLHLDLTEWTVMAPMLRASGVGKMAADHWGRAIEEQFGPIVSTPVALLSNLMSNFVLNTPLSGNLMQFSAGVDPFKGTTVFHSNTFGEMAGRMVAEASSYAAPATLMQPFVEAYAHKQGPISLITRRNPGIWERVVRRLSSMDMRYLDRKEQMASLLLRHGGKDLVKSMVETGLTSEQKDYKAAVFRLAETKTPEEFKKTATEARDLLRGLTTQTGQIGGQRFTWSVNDEELMEKVLRDAGSSIYSVIDRLPIDRAVQAARQLAGGIGKETDPEMRYLWRTLQDPAYLKSKDSIGQLMDALQSAFQFAEEAPDPAMRQNFTRCAAQLALRIRQLVQTASTRAPLDLAKEKMGSWNAKLLQAYGRQIGLVR